MTEPTSHWGKAFKAFVFFIGAVACFGLTLWLAYVDKVTAATLMAGMFIVMMLFQHLPEMESFKAFSIEAKMRSTLSEAKDVLEGLKAAALMSGKIAYHNLGWQSRMAHPIRKKQALANEVDEFLKSAGVNPEEITKVKYQYIRFLLFDLDQTLRSCTRRLLNEQLSRLQTRASAPSGPMDEKVKVRQQEIHKELSRSRSGLEDSDDFSVKLSEGMGPPELLDEDALKALESIRQRVQKAGDECVANGRLVEDAAKIIETTNDLSLFKTELANAWP